MDNCFAKECSVMIYLPTTVFLGLSYACNMKCQHCYARTRSRSLSLTFGEVTKIVDKLKELFTCNIILGHGEPFLYPQIFEVLDYIKKQGMNVVVMTNGLLVTNKIIAKLKDVPPHYLSVSLDYAAPHKHDRNRGVPGAWQAACNTITNLKKTGFRVKVASVVDPHNPYEFFDLVETAKQLNADGISFLTLRGSDTEYSDADFHLYINAMKELVKLMYTEGKYIEVHDPLLLKYVSLDGFDEGMRDDFIDKNRCVAGTDILSILPDGTITPCNFVDLMVGNIRTQSIANVWENSAILQGIRNVKDNKECKICSAIDECAGGCFAFRSRQFRRDSRCLQ